jgi:hypothetical protein
LKKSHEKVIKGYYYRVQHQHQPRFAKKTRQLVGALATQMIDELLKNFAPSKIISQRFFFATKSFISSSCVTI